MKPLYFGDPQEPLFGAYHPPEGPRERSAGVLICYPAPQEYMASHWALRKLALALAREGFHVFRFDYYGSGDSSGEAGAGTLARWRCDLAAAAEELKDLSGVRRISVVGFRLGAALASQVPLKVKELVLWEPVVDGRAYIEELREAHPRVFAHCLHPPELGPLGAAGELMGLPFPPAQEEATAAIDLLQPLACRADQTVIVASRSRSAYVALRDALARPDPTGTTVPAELHIVEEAQRSLDEPFLLSSRAQQVIVARLTGKSA